jgi:indolepyruvate ferredoxin oxidoreductase, beta subunit
MKYDIVLAGVGGQGGLSVSVVIARAAMAAGLRVKQSEVHGMSQRGGEVLAHLRLGEAEPASPIIPMGAASLILAFEPLEALRYLKWLSPTGTVAASITPIRNIASYPDIGTVLADIRGLPNSILVDAESIGREAGNVRAANIALVGAVSALLPIAPEFLETAIREVFAAKGEKTVALNLRAFSEGRKVRATGR